MSKVRRFGIGSACVDAAGRPWPSRPAYMTEDEQAGWASQNVAKIAWQPTKRFRLLGLILGGGSEQVLTALVRLQVGEEDYPLGKVLAVAETQREAGYLELWPETKGRVVEVGTPIVCKLWNEGCCAVIVTATLVVDLDVDSDVELKSNALSKSRFVELTFTEVHPPRATYRVSFDADEVSTVVDGRSWLNAPNRTEVYLRGGGGPRVVDASYDEVMALVTSTQPQHREED